MSDNRIPSPGEESPFSPPPPPPVAPTAAPALPAQPVQPAPAPQPTQSYPGAAPTYPPPVPPHYGVQPTAQPQPGYAPPPAQPGYGVAPAQPVYAAAPVQPGYAPYAASAYPAAAPRPTSTLAITSLICGLAGIVLFWAVIPLLASIAAVITGHMALGQTKRDPGIGGRGLAITGLILGYVVVGIGGFVLISTIISFVFLGAFSLPFVFSN
ncbi:DUF4190 domain-containing protein [Microbacterium sp. NPDC090218]